MKVTYVDAHKEIILENLPHFFSEQLIDDPEALLEQLERELRSLYVRQGNDWTGRGEIGDPRLEATIAVLEAVRAECLQTIESSVHNRSQ
ncbi:hypothetical protein [Pelovirga terrestris]|uniref:Uncharacterized protein n=1 Tax=Pelovirga terrestris TaxID=2771352 RepID=A0A8J6QWJ7_9BACT|nr:hypothetical protein [Pelovirga terrestris]MBD1399936.1 hypothetical protein [Pelovirga terrestris]